MLNYGCLLYSIILLKDVHSICILWVKARQGKQISTKYRAYVFWQDAKLGKITKIGRERARGD